MLPTNSNKVTITATLCITSLKKEQWMHSCFVMLNIPEDASSLSNLLMSQSRDPENWAQFLRFPLIKAARKNNNSKLFLF